MFALSAAIQVAKASDFGRNDRTFFVRTHLGHLLHAGDNALGYDMSTSNMVNPDLEAAAEKGFTVPDVILVQTPGCTFFKSCSTDVHGYLLCRHMCSQAPAVICVRFIRTQSCLSDAKLALLHVVLLYANWADHSLEPSGTDSHPCVLSILSACMREQVRKSYEEKRKRRRARGQKRPWRLKRMAMELEDEAGGAPGRGREQRGGPGGTRREQDMERFMQACLLPHDLFITAACPMHVTSACLC